MWNPFKKKDPLEGQKANYALAFDILPLAAEMYNKGNFEILDLENVSAIKGLASIEQQKMVNWKKTEAMGTGFNHNPAPYVVLVKFSGPFTLTSVTAAIFLIDQPSHKCRLFTMEESFGGSVVVEIVGRNRANTGITVQDATQFMMAVMQYTGTSWK